MIWFGSATNVNDAKEVIGFIDNLKQNIENGLIPKQYINPNVMLIKYLQEIYGQNIAKTPFYVLFVTGIRRCSSMGPLCRSWTWCCNRFNTEALHNLLYYHGMIIGEQYYILRRPGIMNYTNYCLHIISTGILEGFSNLDGFIDNLALMCPYSQNILHLLLKRKIRIAPYFVTDNDPHIEYKTFNIIKEFYNFRFTKSLRNRKYAQGRYYQFNYYRTTFIPESKRFGKLLQTSWVA